MEKWKAPHPRSARFLTAVAGLAAACLATAIPSLSMAATQSLRVQAAPNAQATRPVAITATGEVGVQSTIATYAELGGNGCAMQAGDEAASGAKLVDQRTVSGPFTFSAAFTPAVEGTYSICTYLDGAAGGTIEHQNQAFNIAVAPAPPRAAPAPQAGSTAPPGACVVPTLKRHTLGGARHLLTIAHCKLGRVYKPSAAALRTARRRAGGRTPDQVVVSQTPAAKTVRVPGYTVAVRLGLSRAPRPRTTPPTS